MDSGNTSSMQSEGSGGDEQPEYDSTSFFMHPNATIQPILHHLPSSTSHRLLPLRDHDHSHQQQQQQQQQTSDPFSCSSRRLDLFATAGSSMRQQLAAAPSSPGGALMNRDAWAAAVDGPAQPDPTSLAFQRLIQQQQQQQQQLQQLPLLIPPTLSRTSDVNSSPPAFGVMMNVDVGAFDPSAVRLGFGPSSSNSPQNHNYVRSCGALTPPPPPPSSSTDELAPPQGNINADHRNQ